MGRRTMVILAKGGTKERTLPLEEIDVPDLWHGIQRVRTLAKGMKPPAQSWLMSFADEVEDVWYLAGHLKEHIEDQPDLTPLEVLAHAGEEEGR